MRYFRAFFFFVFSVSIYGQEGKLAIIRHTENDLITPKDLKVVFRGIVNELFIDVPKCKSFEVSGNGIAKKDNSIYNIMPGVGKEISINVDIVLKTGKKVTEKYSFEIRNVKSPVSFFNHMDARSPINVQKQQLKDGLVSFGMPDKNIGLSFEISQFSIHIPGRKTLVVNGNKIDTKTFAEINRYANKSDVITIFDFKSKSKPSFNGCILHSPIAIKIL